MGKHSCLHVDVPFCLAWRNQFFQKSFAVLPYSWNIQPFGTTNNYCQFTCQHGKHFHIVRQFVKFKITFKAFKFKFIFLHVFWPYTPPQNRRAFITVGTACRKWGSYHKLMLLFCQHSWNLLRRSRCFHFFAFIIFLSSIHHHLQVEQLMKCTCWFCSWFLRKVKFGKHWDILSQIPVCTINTWCIYM